MKSRENKKLMIIGCGRSGTGYITKLLKLYKIDIGHEELKKHGISSWYLVPPKTNDLVGALSFKHVKYLNIPIVHQVRDPLKTISSAQSHHDNVWIFIQQFIPIKENDSLILKCMKYWYYWNKLAEKKAQYTYRIENIENELQKILDIGKFNIKVDENLIKKVSKDVNKREHTKLT